jgi:probable HAF family extracellular repeat protein
MKFSFSDCIAAIAVVALLASSITLAAQEHNTQRPRYQLIDMGTLGGPNSIVNEVFYEIDGGTAGARVISDQGVVAGQADTSTADPLCYFDDCFYPNTFQWQNGTLTDLGALPGAQWSSPNWISGSGLIAGISMTGQNDPLLGLPNGHAVLWRGGAITDVGTLQGGYESFGWGVNNHGQVVGFSTNGTPDPYSYYYTQILGFNGGTQSRAFLWDEQHGVQDLGTLGGPDAWAAFVNERGQVAGISLTGFTPNPDNGATCAANVPPQNPFVWEKSTGMVDIGSFGGTCGAPQAMNNRGQVVGGSYLAGNAVVHAFLWDKNAHSRLKDLGTLGGDNSVALWIDDAGDVIGYADVPNAPGCAGSACVHHAFMWKHGAMKDLGSIGTDPCSRAISINAGGKIVGFTAAVCGAFPTHGFLWQDGGPAVDLNTLVNTDMALLYPLYINDRDEIAGNGVLPNGDTHAFLLIPCDSNHSNVDGCDYSMVDGSDFVSRPSPVVSGAASRTLPQSITPRINQYRFPGLAVAAKN